MSQIAPYRKIVAGHETSEREAAAGDEKKQAKLEKLLRDFLSLVGEDPEREGLLDTPERVARSWARLTAATAWIRKTS